MYTVVLFHKIFRKKYVCSIVNMLLEENQIIVIAKCILLNNQRMNLLA